MSFTFCYFQQRLPWNRPVAEARCGAACTPAAAAHSRRSGACTRCREACSRLENSTQLTVCSCYLEHSWNAARMTFTILSLRWRCAGGMQRALLASRWIGPSVTQLCPEDLISCRGSSSLRLVSPSPPWRSLSSPASSSPWSSPSWQSCLSRSLSLPSAIGCIDRFPGPV